MRNPVSKYFNSRAEKREEQKLFDSKIDALVEAILAGGNRAVATIFDDIKVSPLFTHDVSDLLLRESLRIDNVAIFSILMSTQTDPNYWFKTSSSYSPFRYDVEHILHAAIAGGNESLALLLAKDEKISIDASGYEWTSYIATNYSPPLEFAEEKGMYAVAEVLGKRIAREYDLRACEAKAKQSSPYKQLSFNI